MKKLLLFISLLFATTVFAQDIPTDSFGTYRKVADSLFNIKQTSQSIELYERLAQSGDALSAYELYGIYSQGLSVEKDISIANKWLSLAQSIEREKPSIQTKSEESDSLSFQQSLNYSGVLIEKGAQMKNAGIGLGIAGVLTGGIMSIVGGANMNTKLIIAGGAVAGGMGVIALIIDAMGNSYIKDGGKALKNIRFSGNGINFSF